VEVLRIERSDSTFPPVLVDRLGDAAPSCLHAMGDTAMLRNRLLGLVCSIQCPGSIVIQTLDAVRALRDAGATVIGGFHSPMERECLDLLLRGDQPVVLCPARGLVGLRIGQNARRALGEGRLLVLSLFDRSVRRTTATQAARRNELVAALADAVLVPHAAPGGKAWAAVFAALERRQPVCTFVVEENAEILRAGARGFAGLLESAIERCRNRATGTGQIVEELAALAQGTCGAGPSV
jgi:predicted Rossmann fold nucleotide-binding protein DprA/Smf involved in DNA uptake